MRSTMNWFSSLFPKVLEKTSSQYNQSIVVTQIGKRRNLIVDGIYQTGPYPEKIFRTVLDAISPFSAIPNGRKNSFDSALVLGIGGGFVLHYLYERFPSLQLHAVDIDPTIVAIGKKYFNFDSIPNLHCFVEDAFTYLKDDTQKYDLIVIDLYIGDEVPDFVASEPFLKVLIAHLSPNGYAVINYQNHVRYLQRAQTIRNVLKGLSVNVQEKIVERNLFFILRNNYIQDKPSR